MILLFQVAATAGPELVAPGVINTPADEYGPTLSMDYRTLYFTLRADRKGSENIVSSRLDGTSWSKPVVMSFSGGGMDKEPYLSPNGQRLYFASRRDYPGKLPSRGGEEAYDLFYVERVGAAGWGKPQPLTGVNSAAYDNYPAVTRNGTVYFGSHREGGKGRNDLWRALPRDGGWQAPENIAELNTPATDADPFIDPDESYIIFSSDRPGTLGQGDLYVSFRHEGHWTEPVNLGPVVNSTDYEFTPWVTNDGLWLYFSRGWGEIWRISTRAVPALRPPPR
jgi:Tol biopolymer transport system component